MIRLRRLNLDNTWLIQWGGKTLVIDPWLSGSEIDGFKAFNEQWHATPALPYSEVGAFDLVLISQGYHDHCHPETLEKLGNNYPIGAVPAAHKKLKKQFATQLLAPIPNLQQGMLGWNEFSISRIVPRKFPASFMALVIALNNEYLFFAPHGAPLKKQDLAPLHGKRCKALITTFTLYQLPFFLGGKINPGIPQANQLAQLLQPQYILNTHDENKIAKGVANQLARIKYPTMEKLSNIAGFKNIPDYSPVLLE
jgi:hypothetical protein